MKKNSYIDKNEINELVKRIGMGDDSAYDILYPKMSKAIYYFLLRYDLCKEDIQDIINDTFTIVIQKAQSKMIYTNCFSWIITIAKYQFNNFKRKKHLDYIVYDSECIDSFVVPNNVIPSLSLKFQIDKLDKFTQQVLYSTHVLNFTERATAKYLNTSVSTVKRRLKDIKNHFEEDKDE